MRPRLTLTRRITDDTYVSISGRPNMGRPSVGGLLLAFLFGAIAFIVIGLVFIHATGY